MQVQISYHKSVSQVSITQGSQLECQGGRKAAGLANTTGAERLLRQALRDRATRTGS